MHQGFMVNAILKERLEVHCVEAKAGKEKQVAEFLQNALAAAIST
jgi:hypothetical protein